MFLKAAFLEFDVYDFTISTLSLWFSSVTNFCSLIFIIYQNRCICTGKIYLSLWMQLHAYAQSKRNANASGSPLLNPQHILSLLHCWHIDHGSSEAERAPPSWCRACSSTRAVAHSTLASLGLNASCTTLTWPGWITCDGDVGSLIIVHSTPMPRTCFPVNPQRAPSSACLCSPLLSL